MHKSSSEARDHACALMRLYYQSQHLYHNVDEKDRGPADELPSLATNCLVAAWKLDPARGPAPLLQVSRKQNLPTLAAKPYNSIFQPQIEQYVPPSTYMLPAISFSLIDALPYILYRRIQKG